MRPLLSMEFCINCNRKTEHGPDGRCKVCDFLSPRQQELIRKQEVFEAFLNEIRQVVGETEEWRP